MTEPLANPELIFYSRSGEKESLTFTS